MKDEQQKSIIKETFNTVACGYDNKTLRFFSKSAEHLPTFLGLRGDEHVLDVATGTGHAALSMAKRLPHGRITGVDFSSGMLEQARKKATSLSLSNTEFIESDMRSLEFPCGCFDAAVCAFGIFFVEDMDAQLSHIVETVKPGGKIAITGFRENMFYPLSDMMFERLLSYGVQRQAQDWKRIATEAGCRELFEQAGLQDIRVEQKNVGYYLDSADEWWEIVWNAGFRRTINQLTDSNLAGFKREHLQEIDALRAENGIWLDVEVLFAVGTKLLRD